MILIDYFLDWNRYNANDRYNVGGNKYKKKNSVTLSSKKCSSKTSVTNSSIIDKPKTNGITIKQGARNSIITFCMLFNSINLLCTFFGELYSNIFLKSIVTPLVVLVNFLWGIRSDDRGIDSIPPIPLYLSVLATSFGLSSSLGFTKIQLPIMNAKWNKFISILLNSTGLKNLYTNSKIAISQHTFPSVVNLCVKPNILLNLPRILCTTCPKSIYHLGDNV